VSARRDLAAWLRRLAAPLLVLALAGCSASVLPSVHSEPERLELAKRMARKHDWTSAIELLKTYIDRNAGSATVDEAIYLLGECYLGAKDYPNAAVEFERLQRDYPESDSSAAASYRMGEAMFGQSRPPDFDQEFTTKALEQWERYRRDFPDHWLVPEAGRRIAICRSRLAAKLVETGELYLKLRQVEPAQVYFRKVEDEFGDTPEVGDALIGLARCEGLLGHKAEAVAMLKDLETRFSGQPLGTRAARERVRIERMKALRSTGEAHRIPDTPPP
jgi:outer membrane protein assembly factor BamD